MTWTSDFLEPFRQQGDPEADQVIGRMVAESGPIAVVRFFNELIRNIDMPVASTPAYVRDFVERCGKPPSDVDLTRVRRGQQVFVDRCPQIALILYFKSLPMTYLNWRLCRTLAITGRLDRRDWPETFARRVGETTQFVFDAMTPGSLAPGGSGVATVLKVRLVHASIRHLVAASPEYEVAKFQVPICQEDLAYTLHTFGLEMARGLGQLATPLDPQTAEDFFHAWRLVGHYLGIVPSLLPRDLADAGAQQAVMLQRLEGSNDDVKSVTRALMDFASAAMFPGKWFDRTPQQLVRFFIADVRAERLGIPSARTWLERLIPLFIRDWFGIVERLEGADEGLERLSNQLGLTLIRGVMSTFKSYKGRSLDVPVALVQKWGLS